MSRYLDRAKELREDPRVHYNCAQAVFLPFAGEAGISEEAAMRVAANFGSGMRRGAVCGAVSGGLMALGLLGLDDPGIVHAYHRRLRERHEGFLDCADLLRLNREQGGEKKPHCDAMVYECVALVEELLAGRSGSKGEEAAVAAEE